MEATYPQKQKESKAFILVVHCLPKTYKSLSKRCPFTVQKGVFHTSKEHLLPCKRASFTVSKSICYFQFMNLYYNTSNVLFLFITSEYLSPPALLEQHHKNSHLSIFLSFLSFFPTSQRIDNKAFM